jgi:hypothetical protein
MPVMRAGGFDDDWMWRGQWRTLQLRARANGAETVEA